MRNFSEYVAQKLYESIEDEIDVEAIETANNKERKKALTNALKDLDYENYIDMLNEMMKDDRTKSLLVDGFGGELGETKFKFSVEDIPVTGLFPTQNEIDVNKSIDYALKKPENIDNYFKNENGCFINFPLVVLNGTWVIDGHHRWSQMYAYNPDVKAKCYNFTNKSIQPMQMLKAVQGAISATLSDDKVANDGNEIPKQVVKGENLFSNQWKEREIKAHIEETAVDPDAILKKFEDYLDDIESWKDVVDYVTSNLLQLKVNNQPQSNAPNRGLMPQTDMAGTIAGDSKTSTPDKKGSGLNRIKDGKIVKGAVKKNS